jgi:serine/threonine-protein kinase
MQASHGLDRFDPYATLRARQGSVLMGKWQIDELLGIGGCAAVYSATHRSGSRFAIKIAHADQLKSPQDLERFRREPYIANRIGHPAVVRVFDDGTTEEGLPFFVMELLEGEPVGASVQRGEPRTFGEVVEIARTMLSVLEVAHPMGIVHRDLKPSNFFRCTSGELKLLDFGIARSVDLDELTQSGMMLGTPAFMAPEQALARRDLVGPQTDIFAIGASSLVLLKGGPLREGNELALAAIEALPSAEDMGLRGPREILRVFERAVSFHVDARFPTAHAMREALEWAARDAGPVALATRGFDPSQPRSASNLPTLRDVAAHAGDHDHVDPGNPMTQAFVLDRRAPNALDMGPASGPNPPTSRAPAAPSVFSATWVRLLLFVVLFAVAAFGLRWVLVTRSRPHPAK